MKRKILILSLIASFFVMQTEAQNRATVNAMNYEISDNLDLKAVASIFGESRDLEDFERRLNDPKLQISNLDLNNDNQVDYLRVIETVEGRTHVVIIQSVLDRDIYQDVATIDIEKDYNNRISVQIVGNEFMYGANYIYEPVYYTTPVIYASFWASNYRPYVSNWYWNYYPSYYYTWNPFPVYRYRNRVHYCINSYNTYNYVTYRRSNYAIGLYNSRRSNWYERRYPNYAFSKRYSTYNNRYDLDRRRGTRYSNDYSGRRDYSSIQNRPQRRETQRVSSQKSSTTSRQYSPQRTESRRDYSKNSTSTSRQYSSQRSNTQRVATQKSGTTSRQYSPQRSDTQRVSSQKSSTTSRQYSPQRSNTQRASSQKSSTTSRQYSPQRTESRSNNSNSRGSNRRI